MAKLFESDKDKETKRKAKQEVTYCPLTMLCDKSLDRRPNRILPYPAVITANADEVVVVQVDTQWGTTETYAIPHAKLGKCIPGQSRARKITRLS